MADWHSQRTRETGPFFLTDANPQLLFCVGDSKTDGDDWPSLLVYSLETASQRHWNEKYVRYGVVGSTAAIIKTYIDANLASVTGGADKITINLGANDVSALPAQATWKASMTSIIDSLRTKWPSAHIYIARPWRRGFATECNSLATWIGDIVGLYATGVHLGPDERVWLENGDDGVTYTVDGIHYNTTTAQVLCASQWKTSMGY